MKWEEYWAVGRSGCWSWFYVTLRKPPSLSESPIPLPLGLVKVIGKVVPEPGFHVSKQLQAWQDKSILSMLLESLLSTSLVLGMGTQSVETELQIRAVPDVGHLGLYPKTASYLLESLSPVVSLLGLIFLVGLLD